MEDRTPSLELLVQKIENYVNTSIELIKLNYITKSTLLLSKIVSYFVFLMFFLLAFVFASIALAQYAGQLVGKAYLGYLFVAALYFIVSMFIYKFRASRINHHINETILKSILKNLDHESTQSATTTS